MFRQFLPLTVAAGIGLSGLSIASTPGIAPDRDDGAAPLRLSVYATAGDILGHLARPERREQVVARLAHLQVSRLFLEGRRGDEYVPPALMVEVRDFLLGRGIRCTGGIATVPGNDFGARQVGALGWLNWESPRTRNDVAGFFRENAPIFDSLIVDDFYCTGDESPESAAARGSRSWGEYRRDLLTGLIPEIVLKPARSANPGVRLILKFPQWYDRFHLFGYDPARTVGHFDAIWVGTEVRNPMTRRMGFVQPTEGYVNFRWLRSIAGSKVIGAWFDHIECTAQNFLDQAYLSVLAGARELSLFRLGDILEGHPGSVLLAEHLPALRTLAARIQGQTARGIPFYKPPDSDAGENLYLMDYLVMAGWPILPVAVYPEGANTLFLGAQAAADPQIVSRLGASLERGAVVTVTPAFIRAAGPRVSDLAGITVGASDIASIANKIHRRGRNGSVPLAAPLDLDASVRVTTARVLLATDAAGGDVPVLTSRRSGKGRLRVMNLRTFSEQDFREAGEWLLAPRPLGLSRIPAVIADEFRREALAPLKMQFRAPAGVALHAFEDAVFLYSFLPEPVDVRWQRESVRLEPHGCRWKPIGRRPAPSSLSGVSDPAE